MVIRLFMVPEKDEFLFAILTMEPANQRLIGVINAIIVFGFAHVVWFQLARTLPPIASSLSVMIIPVVRRLSGAWMLGETLHWQDYAAIGLILAAMPTVLVTPRAASE